MQDSTIKSICDFTFGMLFMFQLGGTVAMYVKGRKHRLQRMMFFFMLYLTGISLFETVYFFFFPDHPDALTAHLTDILEMTVIPCAFIVITMLTKQRRNLKLPILVNALLYGGAMVCYAIFKKETIYEAVFLFSILYSFFIIAYGWISVARFNKALQDNFSDDMLSLYWLRYIVLLYVSILFIWILATVYATAWIVAIYNVCMLVFLSLWCYFVFRQEDMLEVLTLMRDEAKDEKPEPDNSYPFEDNFKKAFEEDRVFLNPRLNIAELAIRVGTNRSYMSAYLNQQLHTTFYEYVNQWRVKRAKELLASSDLPLEQVAHDSGFNSLSSFRRYFTNAVGMTLSRYRKVKLPQASPN